ncbi:MAG TPA: response regulator transcription factor [Terriglobales bacterium]|nr:response regulator transcription factor [Terriglobales bacterium]
MLSSIQVLVAEDFEDFRRYVCAQLRSRPEVEVVSEVSDGLEAVQKARELNPQLILLDIGLPSLNGLEAAQRIREQAPDAKILFVSQESAADIVRKAFSAGGCGYVCKADAENELLIAVDVVLRGGRFIGRRFEGHVLAKGAGFGTSE